MIWKVREGGLGSTAWVPGMPDTWAGWEDSAVPADEGRPTTCATCASCSTSTATSPSLYGHFGQGCIHCRIPFDLYTAEGIEQVSVVHGRGGRPGRAATAARCPASTATARPAAELLPKMFGDGAGAGVPRVQGDLGPAVEDESRARWSTPTRSTSNLRLGADYNPPQPADALQLPGRPTAASRARRCAASASASAGSEGGGTMCPSYMVTREEKHSTRGRARLLFEMMNGEVLTDGWRERGGARTRSICAWPARAARATARSTWTWPRTRPSSCRTTTRAGCGRGTPTRSGWIHRWARLAARVPALANFVTPDAGAARPSPSGSAGMAPQRQHAARSRRRRSSDWFRQRRAAQPRRAAGDPLGRHVQQLLPPGDGQGGGRGAGGAPASACSCRAPTLCCGRPLYDYGLLDMAQPLAAQTSSTTLRAGRSRPACRSSVLEPSCVAVFRDELANLLPDDEDAQRLARQTYMLSEFLQRKAPDFALAAAARQGAGPRPLPPQGGAWASTTRKALLRRARARVRRAGGRLLRHGRRVRLRAGDHYDVSMACGERVLLPAVRAGRRRRR